MPRHEAASARKEGSAGSDIDVRHVSLHESLRTPGCREAELRIQPVRIGGGQRKAPEALQSGMAEHGGHQHLAVALAAMGGQYEHIDQVGKGGVVRYDPGDGPASAGMSS